MSRFERAYCCSSVWRSSSSTIARELCAQRLGRDVLKIGVGSGSVAQQLLSAAPELAWTAIDIDPHMAQAAATRLAGFSNASVKTADATAMPFPDDSFDSVVSCLMLHHIIDWEGAVAEVARVTTGRDLRRLRPDPHSAGEPVPPFGRLTASADRAGRLPDRVRATWAHRKPAVPR